MDYTDVFRAKFRVYNRTKTTYGMLNALLNIPYVGLTLLVRVVVAMIVLMVVTLAAGIVTLLGLGLMVVTLAALASALALWLSINLHLAEGLHECLVVGLRRVECYSNSLSINIYFNILNTLLIGDSIVHLLGATSAINIGHKYGCCSNLLVALLRFLSLCITKAYKCHKAHQNNLLHSLCIVLLINVLVGCLLYINGANLIISTLNFVVLVEQL